MNELVLNKLDTGSLDCTGNSAEEYSSYQRPGVDDGKTRCWS